MKKKLLITMLSVSTLFGSIMSSSSIYATTTQDIPGNNVMDDLKEYEYRELSYEEYVQAVSKSEGITYDAAVAKVNISTRGYTNTRASKYGEFFRYVDLYKSKISKSSTSYQVKYGVLATWYSPSSNESWSSRKWMTIHSTIVEPGNNVKSLTVHSKNATITSNYVINFYGSIKYYILQQQSKSGTISDVFSI